MFSQWRNQTVFRCFFLVVPWRRRLYNEFLVFPPLPRALNQRISEDAGVRSSKPAIINQTTVWKFPESLRQQSALRHVFIDFKLRVLPFMACVLAGKRGGTISQNICAMRHAEYIYTLVYATRWVAKAKPGAGKLGDRYVISCDASRSNNCLNCLWLTQQTLSSSCLLWQLQNDVLW